MSANSKSLTEGQGFVRRAYPSAKLCIRGHEFAWGTRTFIVGIVNTTTDSFSGDGTGADPRAAAELARRMESEGADWIDIGGQSSRPGAVEVSSDVEAARVVPCIRAVRQVTDLPISVDTFHAAVARESLAAGADAVNDIFGLRRDSEMARVVAESGAALVAMHNQRGRKFHDVVDDIASGFEATLAICKAHQVPFERVVLDPGFGFGWTPEQNLEMLRRLPELHRSNLPLMVGTSRKSTIGFVLDLPAEERLEGTAATVALAIAGGADMVRVHDVREMARVVRMADAVVRANWRSRAAP